MKKKKDEDILDTLERESPCIVRNHRVIHYICNCVLSVSGHFTQLQKRGGRCTGVTAWMLLPRGGECRFSRAIENLGADVNVNPKNRREDCSFVVIVYNHS